MNPHHYAAGLQEIDRKPRWLFRDREHAGEQLAGELLEYRGTDALVLGMARGGIPVAAAVAERLGADLDLIVARKLGAAGQEELAIGAIAGDSVGYLNRELIMQLGVPDAWIGRVAAEQLQLARQREQRLRRAVAALDPEGRTVILVDDGLATGATMRAAIRSLRRQRVKKLVAAAPVGSADACELVGEVADVVVCPHRPDPFHSVAAYYQRFDQTSEEEAARILNAHRARRKRT
jgi:predicted phosphoribosyltransferase